MMVRFNTYKVELQAAHRFCIKVSAQNILCRIAGSNDGVCVERSRNNRRRNGNKPCASDVEFTAQIFYIGSKGVFEKKK